MERGIKSLKNYKIILLTSLLFSFAFMTVLCQEKDDYLQLPVLSSEEKVVRDYEVDIYCSLQKPRTVLSSQKLHLDSMKQSNYRIDLTPFYNGFEKDLYYILWPIEKGQRFNKSRTLARQDNPDLTNANIFVNTVSINSIDNSLNSEIEGLEPGLVYYFRICFLTDKKWITGDIIRKEAPICPVDYIDEY